MNLTFMVLPMHTGIEAWQLYHSPSPNRRNRPGVAARQRAGMHQNHFKYGKRVIYFLIQTIVSFVFKLLVARLYKKG